MWRHTGTGIWNVFSHAWQRATVVLPYLYRKRCRAKNNLVDQSSSCNRICEEDFRSELLFDVRFPLRLTRNPKQRRTTFTEFSKTMNHYMRSIVMRVYLLGSSVESFMFTIVWRGIHPPTFRIPSTRAPNRYLLAFSPSIANSCLSWETCTHDARVPPFLFRFNSSSHGWTLLLSIAFLSEHF